MSDTSIRISKEARDEAIRLSGDANSARVLVEDLIWKFKNGELVEASSEQKTPPEARSKDSGIADLKSEIARANTMLKFIGLGLFEDEEGLRNAINLLVNEFGNCPSCNVKMTCHSCGCFLSDHLLPEEESDDTSST